MPPDVARYFPLAFALLAVMAVYRRLRRSIGPQDMAPVRMRLRIALLIAVGCMLLPLALKSAGFLAAEGAGAAAGAALACWGARRTTFRNDGDRIQYLPHTYTGIAVSVLFVGRLAYRIFAAAPLIGAANAGTDGPDIAPPQMMQSPLTVGVFFVLIGYYVCFYAWVLWKARHLKPEDFEEPRSTTLS